MTALQASSKANRASNDTQSCTHSIDELINGANADTITRVDNIKIVAKNVGNAATNAENIDTDSTNGDNIDNVEIKHEKPEEVVMSDDDIDNATVSDNDTDDAVSGFDNAENVTKGETSTGDIPSPLFYGRKQQIQVKSKAPKRIELFGLRL